jgi:hypothetical protein
MTRNRFIHKRTRARFSSEKARQMNRARWNAHNARIESEMPERIRELAMIDAENLPRKQGDMLGSLQWFDARTGKTRRWIIRIGDRIDRITVESPGTNPTQSHGWTWFFTELRSKILRA